MFTENDTLARIGTSCLQQLLENNVSKLSPARWEQVATTFVKLFRTTTPHQLFDETLRVEIDGNSPDFPEGIPPRYVPSLTLINSRMDQSQMGRLYYQHRCPRLANGLHPTPGLHSAIVVGFSSRSL